MSENTVRRPATYEDLEEVPPNKVAEILDGELHVSPRPGPRHALASSALGADLHGLFSRRPGDPGGPGGWWIFDEPELHLSRDVLVPDIAGWRRERMPTLPEGSAFQLAPDWVCEIVSPSTVRRDRTIKMRIYAREGVRHVWLVDPSLRTVEVFRLADGNWVLAQTVVGSAPARIEPFEAAELDLSRWWGETPDPDPAP